VGLGLNRNELAKNPILTDRLIHDLNRDPRLPFGDETFDAVLCTVSVDYLTRPVEVFRDVARVLRPGGLFLVVFSNRFFPPKVVRIWSDADEDGRIRLVEAYFRRTGAFEEPRVFMSRGKPRPADDRYAGLGVPSDPVYAVFADRKGAPGGCTRQLPEALVARLPCAPDEPRARCRWVAEHRCCPHCGEPLAKWQVPQTPFTQWSSPYQFICFNDDCPYYAGGWGALARQGNPGSYRFMYDPDSGTCHAVPVPTPGALRDSIVEAEERS
jgi:SAM-dependent methyltransferase